MISSDDGVHEGSRLVRFSDIKAFIAAGIDRRSPSIVQTYRNDVTIYYQKELPYITLSRLRFKCNGATSCPFPTS